MTQNTNPPIKKAPGNSRENFLARLTTGEFPSFKDIVSLIPSEFRKEPVGRVGFPKRFESVLRLINAETLGDLEKACKLDLENIPNMGAKTVEDSARAIGDYLIKRITVEEDGMLTVIGEMEEYAEELVARDAQIWRSRMGLKGIRETLDSIGKRWDLSRERVRQIESILFRFYSKQYAAVGAIKEYLDNKEFDIVLPVEELAKELHPIIDDMLPPYAPLMAITENLRPKMHVVETPIGAVISRISQTNFDAKFRNTKNKLEKVFRSSFSRLNRSDIHAKVKGESSIFIDIAIAETEKVGFWDSNDTLISPDRTQFNICIGLLQGSKYPIHINDLAETVSDFLGEKISGASLRGNIFMTPKILPFGHGTIGFKTHLCLDESEIKKIQEISEKIITKGRKNYQWSAKDIVAKILETNPEINIDHHQLRIALMESSKVKYLGRLTWVKNGSAECRTFYRDIFAQILEESGEPLPEEEIVKRAKKVRGIQFAMHLKNDPMFLEVEPKIWGLTDRDQPFSEKEKARLRKLLAKTELRDVNKVLERHHIDTHGIKPREILKIAI